MELAQARGRAVRLAVDRGVFGRIAQATARKARALKEKFKGNKDKGVADEANKPIK